MRQRVHSPGHGASPRWDVRDQICDIDAPTLVLSTEYDEIKPSIARDITGRIPNSEIHVFEESSHMPFWEEPDANCEVVESFLAE
ncbi:hypothetical protein [Halobacterium sp. R2-5]|uniref:hypothetical protein n=1 Tax=Halobacterium sp. R2-5 TaxID=2715751 RepID=UPI001420160C|nr:hypothetical protein [Halobacterium sp. R2-5]NIC01005.1 hypothetical protein [Halobacterium sp. R2-5]